MNSHPAARLFPPVSNDELQALAADIKALLGGDVCVLIQPEVPATDAVRLLRSIAAWIEIDGFDEFPYSSLDYAKKALALLDGQSSADTLRTELQSLVTRLERDKLVAERSNRDEPF